MKYILPLLLSCFLVVGNSTDSQDKTIVDNFGKLYGVKTYSQLLPKLKIEFLRFADVTEKRQSWHAIKSDYDCIKQIRCNAMPTSYSMEDTRKFLRSYVPVLLAIKEGRKR